jgi:membrane protease YdiL (CAAX protease family)
MGRGKMEFKTNRLRRPGRFPDIGPAPSRLVQVVEISVFLLLIVPSLVFSFFAVKHGTVTFTLTAVATIFRDLALLALVLYFLWRNGEPVARIGWRGANPGEEVVLGLMLFVPVFLLTSGLEVLLNAAGLKSPSTPRPSFLAASGPGQLILASLLVAVVAVTEETIFRGYLILRFEGTTGKIALAVAGSAFVFSLGHGYEGSAGVVTVGVMGLIFALVYLWRRSLVAPMVMHFLQDFLGLVVMPIVLRK